MRELILANQTSTGFREGGGMELTFSLLLTTGGGVNRNNP